MFRCFPPGVQTHEKLFRDKVICSMVTCSYVFVDTAEQVENIFIQIVKKKENSKLSSVLELLAKPRRFFKQEREECNQFFQTGSFLKAAWFAMCTLP